MSLLQDRAWKTKYTTDDGDLVSSFYVPALECAKRYDRTTGYFSASALTLAARGIAGLVRNEGKMRLIVGCTLHQQEVEAISQGTELRTVVESKLATMPLEPSSEESRWALELLSWMVAKEILEVKVAVPCDKDRVPVTGDAIFHEKCGVIEDKTGARLAFSGSLNETAAGWSQNWESFHVYADWLGTKDHVDAEDRSFTTLWEGEPSRALVFSVPAAMEADLLKFLPPDDVPHLLKKPQPVPVAPPPVPEPPEPEPFLPTDPRRLAWGIIQHAASSGGGGELVGEATCGIQPWPHQVKAFQRLYYNWPPKLLIADEVGLGKTIEAGMLLRQAWLSGLAKRILILTPKAVLRQWQIELREKFNLNWPIYDGHKLSWHPTRALELQGRVERVVGRDEWHKEPFVFASSQLMRRKDRAKDLLVDAAPWDLIVVDEAHHARRRSAGAVKEGGPNQLLHLLRDLRFKTKGLLLLTATPMQVSPVEVWDLLDLLGMPPEWSSQAFLEFFKKAAQHSPSHDDMAFLARLFRAVESGFGAVDQEDAKRFTENKSGFKAKKILGVLRDTAVTPLKQLDVKDRQAAIRLMMANTPVSRLVSRHTRELLRAYFKAGKISTRISDRVVEDKFVDMTADERALYDEVEDYISATYEHAEGDKRNAVGFIMTTYRRRLASSFHALRCTLENRQKSVASTTDDDIPDDEAVDEVMDADEAATLDKVALAVEEKAGIEALLRKVRRLPQDSKAKVLLGVLGELKAAGYEQTIIFTQYTDTMDFLRAELSKETDLRVVCFSGRGGEQRSSDGTWQPVAREHIKRIFRAGNADLLLCTDAGSEGLNFQFCGALVNYDMPWNPMRVEQRIGRIDRLGQRFENIRIVNLHLQDTVETDVYMALRRRIGLFVTFVGRLQPILARLPKEIAQATLGRKNDRERVRANLVDEISQQTDKPAEGGFDIDAATEAAVADPVRPPAPFNLKDLDSLIRRPKFLPPGLEAQPLGHKEYSYSAPGLPEPLRVTTDPTYFDEHSDSTELWSPGSPLFPSPEVVASPEEIVSAGVSLKELLHLQKAGG